MITPEENHMASHPQPSVANGQPEAVGYGQWRLIESCPADCTVLLFMALPDEPLGCDIGWLEDGDWMLASKDNEPAPTYGAQPTHWMPLPTNPANADASDPMPSPREAKPLPSVEDVARIIDPDAWDTGWAAIWGEEAATFGQEFATTKATTILALIPGEGE